MNRDRVVISTSWANALDLPRTVGHLSDVRVEQRRSDWGKGGIGAQVHYVAEGVRTLWRARDATCLVVSTTCIEAFVIGALSLLPHRQKRVVVDFLMPRSRRFGRLQSLFLRQLDHYGCIRSGDSAELTERYAVPSERCSFISFPATRPDAACVVADDGFVYAGGIAHRDWTTLFQALNRLDVPAVISAPSDAFPVATFALDPRLSLPGPLSPHDARLFAARASVVVVPMRETTLPAGPVVLLDAMLMGKAIVATNTNGTRDYIRHGVDGLLVPPADSQAMADAIERLYDDPSLRSRIGESARTRAVEHFSAEKFADDLLAIVQRVRTRS